MSIRLFPKPSTAKHFDVFLRDVDNNEIASFIVHEYNEDKDVYNDVVYMSLKDEEDVEEYKGKEEIWYFLKRVLYDKYYKHFEIMVSDQPIVGNGVAKVQHELLVLHDPDPYPPPEGDMPLLDELIGQGEATMLMTIVNLVAQRYEVLTKTKLNLLFLITPTTFSAFIRDYRPLDIYVHKVYETTSKPKITICEVDYSKTDEFAIMEIWKTMGALKSKVIELDHNIIAVFNWYVLYKEGISNYKNKKYFIFTPLKDLRLALLVDTQLEHVELEGDTTYVLELQY